MLSECKVDRIAWGLCVKNGVRRAAIQTETRNALTKWFAQLDHLYAIDSSSYFAWHCPACDQIIWIKSSYSIYSIQHLEFAYVMLYIVLTTGLLRSDLSSESLIFFNLSIILPTTEVLLLDFGYSASERCFFLSMISSTMPNSNRILD